MSVAAQASGAPAPRFPPAALDEIRARTPLPALIGRDVKLSRASRGFRGCCPFHTENNPSFFVYPDHYHCFGCGAHGDAFSYLMQRDNLSFLDAAARLAGETGVDATAPRMPKRDPAPAARGAEETDDRRRRAALRLFLEAKPSLAGTPAAEYLAARGIDLALLSRQPRSLRFHPALQHHESGRVFPALIAGVVGPGGAFSASHRTWLQQDEAGRWVKARVANPKLSLGIVAAGCIPIWRGASGKSLRDAGPDEVVVIGEGIETCLSIALACPELRVLAAVSLGNLGRVALPEQVRSVILAADNDVKEAARRGLQRAVELHLAAGRSVRVARSPVGKDFNDALQAWV